MDIGKFILSGLMVANVAYSVSIDEPQNLRELENSLDPNYYFAPSEVEFISNFQKASSLSTVTALNHT